MVSKLDPMVEPSSSEPPPRLLPSVPRPGGLAVPRWAKWCLGLGLVLLLWWLYLTLMVPLLLRVQDECVFGSVGNAEYRRLLGEAKQIASSAPPILIYARENDRPKGQIGQLQPPGLPIAKRFLAAARPGMSLPEQIAAMHATMRALDAALDEVSVLSKLSESMTAEEAFARHYQGATPIGASIRYRYVVWDRGPSSYCLYDCASTILVTLPLEKGAVQPVIVPAGATAGPFQIWLLRRDRHEPWGPNLWPPANRKQCPPVPAAQ